jgi:hypothetical protein
MTGWVRALVFGRSNRPSLHIPDRIDEVNSDRLEVQAAQKELLTRYKQQLHSEEEQRWDELMRQLPGERCQRPV